MPGAPAPWRAAPFLPPELAPFRGVLPETVLADADVRAHGVGRGGDEVLVAAGAVTCAGATRALAAHLGLAVADDDDIRPPEDAATARAVLRTGVMVEAAPGGRPRFTMVARGREVRRLMRGLRADATLAARVRLVSRRQLARVVMARARDNLVRDAAFSFRDRNPAQSAGTLLPARTLLVGAAFGVVPLLLGLAFATGETLIVLQALLSLVFLSWIALRLAGCFFPPQREPGAGQDIPDRHLPVYTILIPLYREAASLPGLVAALGALDYPREKLDIKLVVEADDAPTRAAVAALGLPPHMEEIAVPPVGPRTKPKALNMALAFARGSHVAVYDAEDLPEPDQLRRALAAFRAGGADVACVQARLCVDNGAQSWISRHFAVEYAGHFDVLLPVLSALDLPIPLGGTSNHFRRRVLEAVGGWDPFNVTEDADLGVRLARAGWRTLVIASTTYEEAPITTRAWRGQRSRWLKGWAQTILVHARAPRALVRDLGLPATLGFLVLTAGPFAAALLHPFCVALLGFHLAQGALGASPASFAEALAASLAFTTLIAGYLGTAATCVTGVMRRGWRISGWQLATIPLYWLLLSLAAWRALVELVRRPFHWEKTEHGLAVRPGAAPGRIALRHGEESRIHRPG